MDTLTDRDLLLVWEKEAEAGRSLIEKSLALLEWAYPEYNPEQLASMPIGERDARLLQIREQLFGPALENTAFCPACGLKIEWETHIDSLKLLSLAEGKRPGPICLSHEGRQIYFRLPSSADMLELMAEEQSDISPDELIRRCVVRSDFPSMQKGEIPLELKRRIIAKMEENDPQADISIRLSCPNCGEDWALDFDIMHYLWMEIDDWAYRTIRDIGLLAYYFGWAENDILAMSRFRRNLYLNLLKA